MCVVTGDCRSLGGRLVLSYDRRMAFLISASWLTGLSETPHSSSSLIVTYRVACLCSSGECSSVPIVPMLVR